MQLMTVHSAKGLEFDAVFITGLEEGLFPHENSLNEHDGLEEERRLMYVAITRARKRLYLSFSQTPPAARPDALQHQEPLLRRVARGALKWLTPKNQSFGSAFGAVRLASASGRAARASAGRQLRHARRCRRPRRMACAPGMKVFHTKFGEGAVMSIEGRATMRGPR